jgi:hypothetical protein
MSSLTTIADLLTDDDAEEVANTFEDVIRTHNEQEAGWEAVRKALENWSGDLPEHFFF